MHEIVLSVIFHPLSPILSEDEKSAAATSSGRVTASVVSIVGLCLVWGVVWANLPSKTELLCAAAIRLSSEVAGRSRVGPVDPRRSVRAQDRFFASQQRQTADYRAAGNLKCSSNQADCGSEMRSGSSAALSGLTAGGRPITMHGATHARVLFCPVSTLFAGAWSSGRKRSSIDLPVAKTSGVSALELMRETGACCSAYKNGLRCFRTLLSVLPKGQLLLRH